MNKRNLYKQQSATHLRQGTGQEAYLQPGERPWVRRVARGMAALLLSQATFLAVPVHAQVTPNVNAPAGQRPIMDAAQNGVPIVHIAPPSAGGVSRNQYDQFNVAPNGLILNNSPTAVQTQQGGWITGNMQLGPVPARIILNEVVGANPSQLRGTIEVAGQRANIVVANPNGISCDGCGFLNTGRATLTTGQTQFDGNGGISGFDVRQGQVNVGNNGLNAANIEQLDLIARGIVIEGEVWAKNLNVLAGANQVLYGTLQAAAQSGSGPAPQFAIDIKNLGGMYANQIYLVSSELGVGVNSTGRMAALQGNLVLSANGDLSLKDSYAKQNLQIATTGKANLTGQTQSDGNAAITASGTLTNSASGLIDSADTRIHAATVDNSGRLYGDMLRIHADTVNNSDTGVIAARNTLLIGAQAINNTNGALIYSLGDIGIGGSIDANGQLQGSAHTLTNASARIEATGALAINANNILNRNDGLNTTQVTDAPVHTETVQPNGSATQYATSQCNGIGGNQDDNSCVVHPDKYGQRSTVLPAMGQVCVMDPNTFNQVCTFQPNYAWNAPIFARFGVTPVSSAPPTEPAGGCSSVDPNFGMVTLVNSPACNQWRTDATTWNTAFQATLTALDIQITPYNAQVTEDNRIEHFEDYTRIKLDATRTRTVVASTAPGQILSGGSMNISGSVINRDSQIVAGGALAINGPAVANIATQGEDRTDYSGTAQFTEVVACGTFGNHHCRNWYGENNYSPAPLSVMTDLPTVRFEQNVGNQTVVRTPASSLSNLTTPSNSLFLQHPEPNARYLVETDPRFTNFRTFLGSDYFLQSLQLDPQRQLKRYGDGFLEQQLVNDQILALTGRRYLDGYSNTEAEYKALMDAGVAFTKKYQLTPGVALTAEQMALLTTDIVWLVERTVTLADGTTRQVLAPQVYLRRPQSGDLQANGSLIAGNDILIQSSGDLVNSGTISGNTVTAIAGHDLVNQGGRIGGQDLYLRANNDLKNLSGVILGKGESTGTAGNPAPLTLLAGRDIVLQTLRKDTVNNDGTSSRSSVQHIATIQGGDIQLQAGRDLHAVGASITADNTLTAVANRDIRIAAVAGEYQLNVQDQSGRATQGRTGYISESATTNQTANFQSGGNLVIAANGNVSLTGANINAGNNSSSGDVTIQGSNVSIEAVKNRSARDLQTIGTKSYNRVARDDETLVSGSLSAAGNVTVRTTGHAADGNGNIVLTGANVAAQNGQVTLAASNDVTIQNDSTRHVAVDESYNKSGNLFKTTTTTTYNKASLTQVEGSAIRGNTITLQAGNDVAVRGSSAVGTQDVGIQAGNNVMITSAQDRYQHQQSREEKTSGFTASYSAGVASIGYGKSSSASQASVEASSQHGASIESLEGSTRIQSGQQLTVIASDISAGKDLTLIGKSVDLSAAQNTSVEHGAQQSQSSGFSIGVTVDPFSAFSNAYQESGKNNKTTSTVGKEFKRAEATADGILAASTPIVIQAGSRSANATQDYATSDAKVSTLKAGGDLTILATDGSIHSQGSSISAEGDALLLAKNHLTLDVGHNLESQSQDNKASGWSFDNRGSLPVGVFNNKGNGLGDTDTITGTSLSVGGKATLATTEGDITLTGSNIAANGDTVINAARNLTLQSGQDRVANDNHSDSKAIGKVVISDTERFAGFHKENHNDSQDGITQIDSNVASLQGNVTLAAGDKYTQKASNVLAANDISISGKAIDIATAANSGNSAQDNSDLKIGMFARISSPVIDLVNNIEGASKSDGRLQAMQGMAAAANAYQAISAASKTSGTLIKGEVGIGFASSSSQDQTSGSQAQGSTINGGNDITLTATEGNIHATGSSLSAGKALTLDAAKDILLDAGQSSAQSSGNNRSAGVEVGVGFSVGAQTGVYAYVAANAGHGDYNNAATINSNTHLAGETVALQSKGDTTLKGADVKADTINADVKGKLAVESVQDTVTQHNAQSNVGVRVQVSIGTAWEASGSFSKASGDSSATYVNEQSGLFAGNDGYHVNADTVDLKGGAITSTNAANAALTTNAITFSNLENEMTYNAGSVSLAGSMSGGSGAGDTNTNGSKKPEVQQQTFGSAKSGNVTPGLPMQEKGSAHSTTYATLTDGTITIGGKTTDSAKDLGINTEASTAHTKIAAAPDIKAVMQEQQAISAAAGTVIATSKQVANDIAANAIKTQQAAQKVIDNPNSSDEERAQARQTIIDAQQAQKDWGTGGKYSLALAVATGLVVDGVGSGKTGAATANAVGAVIGKQIGDLANENKWQDGSLEKTILHGLAGLIQAKIGGTDALAGATAGAAKEALTPAMESFLASQGYQYGTSAFNDMMKLGSALVGAAAGAAVGGNGQSINAGSNIALNAETYNRQLHLSEIDFLHDKSRIARYMKYMAEKGQTLSEAEASKQLDRYAAAMVDEHWAKLNGRDASTEAFIKQESSSVKLSYFDSAGVKHAGFTVTSLAEYKDETINLRSMIETGA
ncbi:MAG: hemagglutinin repeat-containing protein, partial [Proteobacteria bacterium]|nr:hemagglutinin repeat-containing protein [Pseudomonadota bacterium]